MRRDWKCREILKFHENSRVRQKSTKVKKHTKLSFPSLIASNHVLVECWLWSVQVFLSFSRFSLIFLVREFRPFRTSNGKLFRKSSQFSYYCRIFCSVVRLVSMENMHVFWVPKILSILARSVYSLFLLRDERRKNENFIFIFSRENWSQREITKIMSFFSFSLFSYDVYVVHERRWIQNSRKVRMEKWTNVNEPSVIHNFSLL